MRSFTKQFIFILLAGVILTASALIILGAVPTGKVKIVGGYQQYGAGRPVAWWKLDEASWNGTAGEVKDSIGTNNGTSTNGANTTSTAVFGRAGSFDGVDDYVDIGNLNIVDTFSISLWYYWTVDNGQPAEYLGSRKVGGDVSFDWGPWGADIGNGSVWLGFPADTGPNPFGVWVHKTIVVTTTGAKIYTNGVYYSEATWATNHPLLSNASSPLNIGKGKATDRYWNGKLDDVRIYNYALTANQVKQIYNETAKLKVVNQENTTTTSNNPVGWWSFDDGVGASAQDKSGNGNTGTLTNGPTWATGKLGKGLSFDGVNDYVDATDIDFTSGTLIAWIKPSSNQSTNSGIVSKRGLSNDTDIPFSLGTVTGTTKVRALIDDGSFKNIDSVNNIGINSWGFIAATITQNGNMALYVNGVLQGSVAVGTLDTNNYTYKIGAHGNLNGASNYFNGLIDDVRIYNRALSAGEVAQMYNSTKDGYLGKIKVSTGLVGYWKLDDASASSAQVTDYSGKNNNGTAYSGTATSTSVLSTSTAMVGRAMSFDGVDDWVDGGDPANNILDMGTNDLTVSAWVKANNPTNGMIVTKYKGESINQKGYNLRYNGGLVSAWIGLGVTSGLKITGTTVGTANVWHYIVATFDRDGLMTVYLDGRSDGSLNISAESGNNNSLYNLYLGRRDDTTPYYFNGLIDEVKIWNYARSAEDIKNDYVNGLSNYQ